jgi:hypothetical protein
MTTNSNEPASESPSASHTPSDDIDIHGTDRSEWQEIVGFGRSGDDTQNREVSVFFKRPPTRAELDSFEEYARFWRP